MSATQIRDRRAERYAATRQEIIEAAWQLARADGLGALAMRELGARVGMRAQSLYLYFPSKFAIFDAMFGDANRALLGRVRAIPPTADPLAGVRALAHTFLEFCVEDPVRYQLVFQRTIPGFEPSPEAYAPALEGLDGARLVLRAAGITDARAFDAWTALIGGLAAQQNANEPGGDRWLRLADEVVDMFVAHFRPTTPAER